MEKINVKCECENIFESDIIKDFENNDDYVNDTCLKCGVNICKLIFDIEHEKN